LPVSASQITTPSIKGGDFACDSTLFRVIVHFHRYFNFVTAVSAHTSHPAAGASRVLPVPVARFSILKNQGPVPVAAFCSR
jgi:hypothetical protein